LPTLPTAFVGSAEKALLGRGHLNGGHKKRAGELSTRPGS
jgi:hypothetical protein